MDYSNAGRATHSPRQSALLEEEQEREGEEREDEEEREAEEREEEQHEAEDEELEEEEQEMEYDRAPSGRARVLTERGEIAAG